MIDCMFRYRIDGFKKEEKIKSHNLLGLKWSKKVIKNIPIHYMMTKKVALPILPVIDQSVTIIPFIMPRKIISVDLSEGKDYITFWLGNMWLLEKKDPVEFINALIKDGWIKEQEYDTV